MSISPRQCRMARAALNWSNPDLAAAAKVGVNTVSRFEQGGDARRSSLEAIRRAFEGAGVVFLGHGEVSLSGGEGVRVTQAAAQEAGER